MGCCGDKAKKAVTVTKGWAEFVLIDLFEMPSSKCGMADTRLYECWACDEQTWMTKREYWDWIWDNKKEVIKNFEDLTKLPKLPKKERAKGLAVFCRICKCFIPAKTYRQEEDCPKGKWK